AGRLRYSHVTGVQTCAPPIYDGPPLGGAVQLVAVDAQLLADVVQGESRGDLHVDAPVAVTQRLGGVEEIRGLLLLLLAPADLALVAVGVDDALVTDAHGDEVDLLLGHREGGVDDHVEQAELGGQEFARAAAPALQEQLDGESVTDEASDVGVDDGGVEAVTLEAPRS